MTATNRPNARFALRDVPSKRRGSILVVVLVVLVVLSLGAYTFSESMIVESQATAMFGRDAQARAAADSGIELAASLLTQRYDQTPHSYYSNPEWFQGILVQNAESPRGRGRFSVVAAVETDPTGHTIRFGLGDESAKLNVNALPKLFPKKEDARKVLQYIPQMTPDISDAILDWIDSDKEPRELGAEDDTYSGLGYKAKNGPIDSIDELLMVRGMTPQLLFGEDTNHNGLLDASENDGDLNPPFDNADGMLDRGWSAYLSVHGREGNYKTDGTQRIHVNMNALGDLYDQVQPILGEDAAKFIVAYRMAGPTTGQSGGTSSPGQGSGGSSGSPGTVSEVKAISEVKGTKASSSGGVQAVQEVQAAKAVTAQGGTTATQGSSKSGISQAASATSSAATGAGKAPVTRGGIDVSAGGQKTINSLFDLVGVQVKININGTNTTLDSPWGGDSSSIREKLPQLLDVLSTKSEKFFDGRINVNQARSEVLMGIPNMTQLLADQIVNAQSQAANPASPRLTTGWLLIDGIVDLPTIRLLDPYLTARGDVFRMQSVGYFEKGGPSARIEAVIDATLDPPAVVFTRDLTDLGRGFSAQLLMTGAGGTQ
jgi:DNA uptake protein ComE-like DNA-binding protein